MRIRFERSGGFTGMRLDKTVESEALDAEQAGALQQEIEASGFFDLPEKISSPGGGADRFQYRIAVESGGRRHTVEVGEAAMPDQLLPLVQHLSTLARTSR
jgi:Emfourin